MAEYKLTSFIDILKTKAFYIFIAFFIGTFLLFSFELINSDAFDAFYHYSRAHEAWDLDEWVLVFVSFFISLSLVLFFISIFLVRKVIALTKEEIEHEKKIQLNQKLQTMGTLLGGLAHSLNNHLLPILTISRIIKDETDKNTQTYEDISKVVEAAEGTDVILKQVLNFTRSDNSALLNSCIIGETLNRALDLIETSIPSSITIKRETPYLNQMIPISRVNLEVIIFNFITNSVYALEGKHGAEIFIKLEEDKNKEFIILEIKDNGSGISKENIRKIFDPFFTTKPQGEGTGLGLAETYGIINNVNGELIVDSKEDEFTKFIIKIPIKKEV